MSINKMDRNSIIINIFILSLPLFSYGLHPFFTKKNISIPDIIGLFFILSVLIFIIDKKTISIDKPILILFLFFIYILSINFIVSKYFYSGNIREWFKTVIKLIYYTMILISIKNWVNLKKVNRIKISKIIILQSVVFALFGIYQFVIGNFNLSLPYELFHSSFSIYGYVTKGYKIVRAASFFAEPSWFGIYQVYIFILSLTLFLRNKIMFGKKLDLFFVLIILSSIIVSFSFSAFALLLFELSIFVLLNFNKKIILKFSLIFLIGFLIIITVFTLFLSTGYSDYIFSRTKRILTSQDTSGKMRLEDPIKITKNVIKNGNILFGIGISNLGNFTIDTDNIDKYYIKIKKGVSPGNGLFLLLNTTGVFGFVLFISFFFSLLKKTFILKNKDVFCQGAFYMLFGAFFQLIVNGVLYNILFWGPIILTYFLIPQKRSGGKFDG